MDRLISQSEVEAIIDNKIEIGNGLLENPLCKGMNRQLVTSQIGALLSVKHRLNDCTDYNPDKKA